MSNNTNNSRVKIPQNALKIIENIKEIAGDHSNDEVYAMLKECSMDPNETAQKLMLQDTFHEVKRKREKRRENVNNRESTDSRWRPGPQGRGGRSSTGIFPRFTAHDARGGRNISGGKENEGSKGLERVVITPPSVPSYPGKEIKATATLSSSTTVVNNGPTGVTYGYASESSARKVSSPEKITLIDAETLKSASRPSPAPHDKETSPSAPNHVESPDSVLGVYSSASDPVLVPSLDSRLPGAVGTIKREVKSQRTAIDSHTTVSAESNLVSCDAINSGISSPVIEKAASEVENATNKPQGGERSQSSESTHSISPSSHGGNSTSRPSSNYGTRSQQLIGSQKAVGPGKEWKPKSASQNSALASGTDVISEIVPITVELSPASIEATLKLQKKLEDLRFANCQHVIIPNHLQVPEAERNGLSFGSFDASFGFGRSYATVPDIEEIFASPSESSQGIEETAEEPPSSQNASLTAHEKQYPDHSQSPASVPDNLSNVEEADISPSAVPEYDEPKPETTVPLGGPHYVHPTPHYPGFGLVPPHMLGPQFPPFDNSEPQARDVPRIPSFVVPQIFDPYGLYRHGVDANGRLSPFLAPGTVKYNAISPQSGQSPPESGNSVALSTTGPIALVTQTAEVPQNPIAVTQQTMPYIRQQPGVHLSQFHPAYYPPPYYIYPHFPNVLTNSTFPQQLPAGSIYQQPSVSPVVATSGKYPLPQYKPETNAGNSTHIAMPTGYGYNANLVTSTGNSTTNEDLVASQYKESNGYINAQQTEGGQTAWIQSREAPGLPSNSFYNGPQGQHISFPPAQIGHGSFAGMYPPAQTMAIPTVHHPLMQQSHTAGGVEMPGAPPGTVYQQQQPQRTQINWTNNY
ncbi:hypothetical protein GIB67_001059 [Kingdonia uniflora]|uniref:GBF-interacting protein 1 N-terminal domain-containing protein n=1 Tax=Kingdonia uniflora TaxID=39325 RepID=A0A7J7MG14_9MAGN|nr:hypothetical protein GIB67_001059 [Kingdonia uniflora]